MKAARKSRHTSGSWLPSSRECVDDKHYGDGSGATKPALLEAAPPVQNPVIAPVMQGDYLQEMPLTTTIHELLLKVTKNGSVLWVGVAVPFATTDFTKIQVLFHPTVVQAGTVHALDTDY